MLELIDVSRRYGDVVASVAILVRIAGRVYAGGALRLRRRVKLREALSGGE